ncbi:MAG: S-layer family protein, partial [Moorea sp. SIO4A3]|nr:S-layer family protein [Moorena sp. SIO4A3]
IDFISSAITLSNGTVVDINGQAEPTLDVRAGVDPTEVGIPGLTGNQFFGDLFNLNLFGRPTRTDTATSADITIGSIAFADVSIFDFNISPNNLLAGKVLLTNQYKPNPSLAGDIEVSATLGSLVPTLANLAIQNGELSQGGSVTIDSRGSITLNGIVNTIAIPNNNPFNPFSGNGGDVTFLANDNITLNPGSFIASAGIEGGKITLNSGSNFLLDDAGVVTLTTGTSRGDKGGNLIVNAPESVTLINTEGSGFSNLRQLVTNFSDSNLLERLFRVFNGSGLATVTTGAGDSGDLSINTRTLSIRNQAQNQESRSLAGAATVTLSRSSGNSGNLTVNAESVDIVGNETDPFIPTPNERLALAIRAIPTGLTTATNSTGKAGDLTINTQRLTVQNGAGVTTATVRRRLENAKDGGNLTINATESVTLSGKVTLATATLNSGNAGELKVNTPTLTLEKGAVIAADTTGSGNAGNLTIKTDQLLVRDGSRIGAATGNTGTGANITVMASEVELVGTAVDDENTVVPSGIFANSQFINNERNELGDAGSININTEKLIVRDGAVVSSSTQGAGAGGTITIDVNTLEITTGGQLRTTTFRESRAGDIILNIDNRVVIANPNSGLFAETEGAGAGGTITITTPELTLQDQGQISAFTSGTGTSGNIFVENADSVELADNSSISTEVRAGAKVNPSSGEEVDLINIQTRSLKLTNSSNITASTSGIGDAGNITIQEAQQVNLNQNSSISTAVNTGADGSGGNIDIQTKSISLDQTSNIEASTAGTGDAGSITIPDAEEVNLNRNSSISTAVNTGADGKGGNIDLKTRSLKLNQSQITASTDAQGNAGSIKIQQAQQVDLNLNSSISTAVNTGADGNGGNVDIETKSLSLDQTSTIEASTAGQGNAGSITIPDADSVNLNRNSSISTAVNSGAVAEKGGNIDLKTRSLKLTNSSNITASTSGKGNAGSIVIQEAQQVDLNRNSSISTAVNTGAEGKGGDVEIETKSLALDHTSTIEASTAGTGDAGSISIPDAEEVSLNRKSSISTAVNPGAVGNGGNVDIKTRTLTLNDSDITASTSGKGDAGQIQVRDAQQVNLDRNSSISTEVNFSAVADKASNIDIQTRTLKLNQSQITASTDAQGNAGSIKIQEAQQVDLNRNSSISTAVNTGAVGNGGNVDIETKSLALDHTSTIEASTAGTGDAGSISIPDAEEVSLNRNSSISTAVNPGAVGNGGNVDIKTRTLTLTNDSEITSSTAGDGDAGNITLRAEQVTIQGESQVSATTSRVTNTDRGKGGNIKIIEANRFEATDGGNVRTTTEGTEQAGNITLEVRDDITLAGTGSGLFANTTSGSSGDGGNIFVDPRTVTIRDGAKIAVDSQGQGKGGSITLEAGTLTLNNKAELSAETASTQGGNITLTIDELLFLRRNSKISTTAGTAQAGGDGGNITIKAPFILGIRQENSDITANAFEGNGGNINITTQGIIGLEFREKLTPLSDITASSEFGVDGTVNINAPGIDPSQGLSELPTDVIDVSQLIEKNLCAAGELYGGSPALYPIGSASGRIAR